MRLLVQRSLNSSVSVDNEIVGEIKKGIVVFVGFKITDSEKTLDKMVDKLINLRIFNDENNIMNLSLKDIDGEILSISQFTLYADTKKGNRPSYIDAMKYEEASHLYQKFNEKLIQRQIKLSTGIFGANMKVNIMNDGPITIMLESSDKYE